MPCLNGQETIALQLEALSRQRWSEPWEVIFSDNGSTDSSRKIAESYKDRIPNLKIVDSSDVRDRAHACNVGVNASTGVAVAFCDVDDEIAPGWVAHMGNALMQDDFVYCNHEFTKLNSEWIVDAWKPGKNYPGSAFQFLPRIAGCRFGLKKKLFDTLGGFRVPSLRAEDADLCWRAQLAGIKLQAVPKAVVHYRFRSTFMATFRQARLDGISSVMMYTRFREYGMKWRSMKKGAKKWAWVITSLPFTYNRAKLLRLIVDFGFLVGYLQGSLKFKIRAF